MQDKIDIFRLVQWFKQLQHFFKNYHYEIFLGWFNWKLSSRKATGLYQAQRECWKGFNPSTFVSSTYYHNITNITNISVIVYPHRCNHNLDMYDHCCHYCFREVCWSRWWNMLETCTATRLWVSLATFSFQLTYV